MLSKRANSVSEVKMNAQQDSDSKFTYMQRPYHFDGRCERSHPKESPKKISTECRRPYLLQSFKTNQETKRRVRFNTDGLFPVSKSNDDDDSRITGDALKSFRNKLMTRSGSSTDEGLCLSSSSDSEQSLSKDDDGSEDDVGFENFKNLELLREKTRIKTIFETYKSDLIIEYLINILTNSQETKILTAFRLLFPEATRAAQQSDQASVLPLEDGNLIKSRHTIPLLQHCARCHKDYDSSSNSPAHHRCVLPHPERMVIVIGRDLKGTDFLCLCCRKEFRLPKMAFYEETTNSMLAGWCYMGTHTTSVDDIDWQIDGGAAKTCEDAGCVEFYV